jgi:hypothetical protein
MDAEQLRAFCDKSRDKVCAPFTFEGFTYATNGHILVRVPRLPDVPEWEAVNEQAANLFALVDMAKAKAALTEIPDFGEPEREPCKWCKGTGKITTCPECDGEGEVALDSGYHEYECECLTCFGDGKVSGGAEICPQCKGVGSLAGVAKIAIGEVLFGSQYLTMIKALPDAKIAPLDPLNGNYFVFEGGEGMLMPMRP